MSKQHYWQDARFKKALENAPDANVKASDETRKHIWQAAAQTLKTKAASNPAQTWWKYLWALFSAKPRLNWNIVATFVVVGCVGLIWTYNNPQEHIDPTNADFLPTTVSQAPSALPEILRPDVLAPVADQVLAPAPTIASISTHNGGVAQEQKASALKESMPEPSVAYFRASPPLTALEKPVLEHGPEAARGTIQGKIQTGSAQREEQNREHDKLHNATSSLSQLAGTKPVAESVLKEVPLIVAAPAPASASSAPNKASDNKVTEDRSRIIADAPADRVSAQAFDSSTSEIETTAKASLKAQANGVYSASEAAAKTPLAVLNEALRQWDGVYISDARTSTLALSRKDARELPELLIELTHTSFTGNQGFVEHDFTEQILHLDTPHQPDNTTDERIWVLAFYNYNHAYLGTFSLQGSRWRFDHTTPCTFDCQPVKTPLAQGIFSTQQAKKLTETLNKLSP